MANDTGASHRIAIGLWFRRAENEVYGERNFRIGATHTAQDPTRDETVHNLLRFLRIDSESFRYGTPGEPFYRAQSKIVQHPPRRELLLNRRLRSRKVLNPGGHVKRSHGRKF